MRWYRHGRHVAAEAAYLLARQVAVAVHAPDKLRAPRMPHERISLDEVLARAKAAMQRGTYKAPG